MQERRCFALPCGKHFRLTLTHLANADNKERPMYYVDHLKNKPRTMPYLDCGTSGVALAFIEVYKDGNESMEFLNEEFLRRLSQGSDMVCTFNGGLFGVMWDCCLLQ